MKYHKLFLYSIALIAMQWRIFVMDKDRNDALFSISKPVALLPECIGILINYNKNKKNPFLALSEQASLMMVNRESYFTLGPVFYEYKKEKRKKFLSKCIGECLGSSCHVEWDDVSPSYSIISLPVELCNCHNEETIKKLMKSLIPQTLTDLQPIVSGSVFSLAENTRRINYCYSDSSVVTHTDLEKQDDVKSKQLTTQENQDSSSINTFLQILVINQQSNNWTDIFNECLKKDISSVIIIMNPLLKELSEKELTDMIKLIKDKLPENAEPEVRKAQPRYFHEYNYKRLHLQADSPIIDNTIHNKSYPKATFFLFGAFLLCLGAVVYKESVSKLIENNFPSLANLLYSMQKN